MGQPDRLSHQPDPNSLQATLSQDNKTMLCSSRKKTSSTVVENSDGHCFSDMTETFKVYSTFLYAAIHSETPNDTIRFGSKEILLQFCGFACVR